MMMMKRLALIPLLLLVPLTSCGRINFKDYSQLGGALRILSLKLDRPEASPGDTVQLEPLVSDTSGGGRALTYHLEICSQAAAQAAPNPRPDCVGAADQTTLVDSAAVTGLTAPDYTAPTNPIPVPVPTGFLKGRSAADQFNGLRMRIVMQITASDGTQETGVKHLIVSTNPTKNSNPTITQIQADGAPLTALPATTAQLSAVFSADSAETYTQQTTSGGTITQTEFMTTTWFVSDGEMDNDTTTDTGTDGWLPPKTAPVGRHVLIIAVTRDGRGGESYLAVTL